MRKRRFVALAAALSLAFPMGMTANVHVVQDQWQLIGVAGLYQITSTTGGSGGESLAHLGYPDAAISQVLVDYRDTQDLVTWDKNDTATSYNSPATVSHVTNIHFANAESLQSSGVDRANNPAGATDVLFNGYHYHATVGLRTINVGTGSALVKTAMGFEGASKFQGSPMRTMYMVSPFSNGAPDVMVVYQGTREGTDFKVSFKNNNSAWDFSPTAGSRDNVYAVSFNRDYTYDNPLRIATLSPIVDGQGTDSEDEIEYYSAVRQIFDMNVSQNNASPSAKADRYLDGALTVYGYRTNGTQGQWIMGQYTGDGSGLEAQGSSFTEMEAGYGYWVRFTNNSTVYNQSTDSKAGFFTSVNNGKPEAYAGKLQQGWNLLAFNDGYLRHATSGFELLSGLGTSVNVFSPNADANITFGAVADAPSCGAFNQHAEGNASLPTNKNTLDVRCYWNGTNAVLVSDKPFFISLDDPAEITNVRSLANTAFVAADMFDHNGSTTPYAVKTIRGEYVVALEMNPDWDGAQLLGRISYGVASWTGVAPRTWDLNYASTGHGLISADFNTLMTAAALETPANGAAKAGRVMRVDLGDPLYGDMLLFAANNRFWVRENTAIRLFDLNEVNTTTASVNMLNGGTATPISGPIGYVRADGTIACHTNAASPQVLINAIAGVSAHCLHRNGDADDNRSLMVYSTTLQNFDIRESDITAEFLMDRHLGQTSVTLDQNASPKGAIARVFQPTRLAQATFYNQAAVAEVTTVEFLGLTGADVNNSCTTFTDTDGIATYAISMARDAAGATIDACGGADVHVGAFVATDAAAALSALYQAAATAGGFLTAVDNGTSVTVTHDNAGAAIDVAETGTASTPPGLTIDVQGADAVFGLRPMANLDNLTYTTVWAEDFPNNGALYQIAGNGYKPEMIITAVTSDGDVGINPAGTITWKALDVTRDPKDWFNENNDFGLFWTESDRGYWVYMDGAGSFTNRVTVDAPNVVGTVHKHFDNNINPGTREGTVFNWTDTTMTTKVGGLVRTNYTSGQSYNVLGSIGGREFGSLSTTGSVGTGKADFTVRFNDFEIPELRPTGTLEVVVKASDGLGGRNENELAFSYEKPQTPVLAFNGQDLIISSNAAANRALMFEGNLSDMNPNRINIQPAFGAAVDGVKQVTINMSTVTGIAYPSNVAVTTDGTIPTVDAAKTSGIIKDLRVIASTGAADTGTIVSGSSVYSNMRQAYYLPVYTGTGHLKYVAASEDVNQTRPTLYPAGTQATRDYGVAMVPYVDAALDNSMAFVFKTQDVTLAAADITHANIYVNGTQVAQVQYHKGYAGSPFYFYMIQDAEGAIGQWYYGVFQGVAGGLEWGYTTGGNTNVHSTTDMFALELTPVSTTDFGMQLSF